MHTYPFRPTLSDDVDSDEGEIIVEFRPYGIIPAVVTPFHADEQLNEEALATLVANLVSDGVHGVFVLGSQGEYYALTTDEKRRVIEVAVAAANGMVPVYAGTGANTTRDAVALTRMAETAGADAVSVITPSFITPTQDELHEHYRAVAAATRLPVLIYSNPGRTGVQISVELAKRLAQIRNIVGIKESSGDLSVTAEFIHNTPATFHVCAGRDTLILATLLYGGTGAVAASGNVAARYLVHLYQAYLDGDMETARATQAAIIPLRAAFALGTFPSVIKEALNMIGLDVGQCRSPVGPLSREARTQLQAVLENMGLLAHR